MQIKERMKSGDVKGAAEELKKLLAAEPDNAEAKMLYGTCCHLLGDDKTFAEIHDELAPKMEKVADGKELSLWRKYHRLWLIMIEVALVLAGAFVCGKVIFGQKKAAIYVPPTDKCLQLYAGPSKTELDRGTAVLHHNTFSDDEETKAQEH